MTFRRGQDTRRGMFAAARKRKPGEMNKVEASYNAFLEGELAAGRVAWFKFEAIKLRLADRTFLTMDFSVLPVDGGILELHDVKGSRFALAEDALVKMKFAAETFPFIFKLVIPQRGVWEVTEI